MMFCPCYDNITGHFQGLYETLGYIMVHGDEDEHFLYYGSSKQDSKILHSYHKKGMPNSFLGTFLISTEFVMNLVLCKRIFHESIISYHLLLTAWRKLIGLWVQSIFYLLTYPKRL